MRRVARYAFIVLFFIAGSAAVASAYSKQPTYPIDSKVVTTVDQTVLPVPVPSTSPKLLPTEISKYSQYGYGLWQAGQGIALQKRLDIMSPGYSGAEARNEAKLLRFFTISDIHVSDKETPAQAIFYGAKGGVSSAYSGVMLYTTHVLDAAVQTINAIHRKNPIDFGLSLGDTCNSTQYNELRWYIDVLDGKAIDPSSGAHVGTRTVDYQKPYQAAGLDKGIPWYQVLGNHDHFWLGFMPPDDYIRQALVGENIVNLGNLFVDPRGLESRGFYMGSIDGSTTYGDVIGVGPEKAFVIPPKVLAADPDRRSLSKKEWIGEFFKTSSRPLGHGFDQDSVERDFGCYSFEPKSKIPVKVIVLDDTQRNDDPNDNPRSLGYGHTSLDQERYDWLVRELAKGQAEGKLMIIAAHIPIGVESGDSMMAWNPNAPMSEAQLIAKLHEFPNLIAWVAGHRHCNMVTAFKSPDANRPELGFWQIETASLRDFPQQFRTFEIIRNSDNTVSILAIDVDTAVRAGTPAARSRSYAVAAQQIFDNPAPYLPTGSYNAELVVQLSPEMQTRIQGYGTPLHK